MWSLADELAEELPDGTGLLRDYMPEDLDRIVGIEGFTKALPEEWMGVRDDGLYLPDYIEHNGTTAKKRAQDQKRQSKKRRQNVAKTSPNSVTEKRLEKRREEVPPFVPPSPLAGKICTVTNRHGLPQGEQERELAALEKQYGQDLILQVVREKAEVLIEKKGRWSYALAVLREELPDAAAEAAKPKYIPVSQRFI